MPKINRNQYSLKEVYTHYTDAVADPLDYKTHRLVLDSWGELAQEYLLKGKDIQLQHGLSMLGVRKNIKKYYIDYVATKAQGRKVLVPNTHSSFYGAKVYWERGAAKFSTKNWYFKTSRVLNRRIAVIMKQPLGHTTFIQKARMFNKYAKNVYNKKVLKL